MAYFTFRISGYLRLSQSIGLHTELSALADTCVLHAFEFIKPELTVVAMGKWGGQELCYGADLDLLFLEKTS